MIHDILRLNYFRLITNLISMFFSATSALHDSAFQEELDIEMSLSEDDAAGFFSPVSQLSPEKTPPGGAVIILCLYRLFHLNFLVIGLQIFPIKNRTDLRPCADLI